MWLSTVQSFKILRSVRKNFEFKRKQEMKRKCGRRKKDKEKKHLQNQEAIKSGVMVTQKN